MKSLILAAAAVAAIGLAAPASGDAQQAPPQRPAARAPQERARQAFIRTDVNKDGVISPEEFQRALRLRQRQALQRRVRQLQLRFRRLDVNKNGVLEPSEFRPPIPGARRRGGVTR